MYKTLNKIKLLIEPKYKIIVILFFIIFLCIGLFIFGDYGISWDEPVQRNSGIITVDYITGSDQSLLTYPNKFYGPVFETLLVAIERTLNLSENPRAIYLMRHLVTFLLFYISVIFFYKLCKYRFKSWKIGLLGSLFLILSPRIFAHSFYNSKDIAFLAMFIISIYTLTKYLNKKTWTNTIFHALACAILIDIRILGIIVPVFTYFFLIADLLIKKDLKINGKKVILGFSVYLILLISLTVLFWPLLWTNPLDNFIEAYNQMRSFPWEGSVLYFGGLLYGPDLPWHYIPVWMLVSIPILYTLAFTLGFFITIKLLFKNPIQFYNRERDDLIFILCFFLPLTAVIFLGSTLYDGWRQMFFIYPTFLILSLKGLVSLFEFIKIKFKGTRFKIASTIIILLIASSFIYTGQFMVRYHPYQNVYFNPIAGLNMNNIKSNFDLDYWGLSYRKALEYILENDKDKTIKIYVTEHPGKYNSFLLPPDDRDRLVYVNNPDEAKYFLSSYRQHPGDYPYENEYYSIEIGGAKIMVVYLLK